MEPETFNLSFDGFHVPFFETKNYQRKIYRIYNNPNNIFNFAAINFYIMIGLIRTIIIFAIIYYITRFITRYILPMLIKKHLQGKFEDDFHRVRKDAKKKEGRVTIENLYGKNQSGSKKRDGEYVDYEEIKD